MELLVSVLHLRPLVPKQNNKHYTCVLTDRVFCEFQHFNISTIHYTIWTSTYSLSHYGILNAKRGFFFPRYRIIHIRTSTFRPTIYQTNILFPLASSTNGSHANHKRYSEPIRSQENNTIFFASNSNDIHVHRPRYSEPFRSQQNIRVFFPKKSIGQLNKIQWTLPITRRQHGFLHK